MKAHIIKTIYFEAARRVDGRLTGYSYRVDLFAGGEVDPAMGWVADYGDIKNLFEPVRLQLDHRCLDDVPGLADTTPAGVSAWVADRLRPWPEWFEGVRVTVLGDGEFAPTPLPADAELGLPERTAFSFAAAQSLPQLPASHPCHHLHGHTYRAEIGAADKDALAAALPELHARLHNHYLNEIPGLEQATCERICAWIWGGLLSRGITPSIVALHETPNNRCVYRGE